MKKKLLILVNDLGFFISHRLPIAEASIDKGFEVVIAYGENENVDLNLLKQKRMSTYLVPMCRGGINPFKELKTFYYIWKLFKKERPDIVHLVSIKPYLYGGIISRLTRIPAVVSAISGLGSLFATKNLISRILRILIHPLYKLSFNHKNQKVILQNNDDVKLLLEQKVIDASNIILIKGSGVKLENFNNLDENVGVLKVCFAARLIKEKGVYEFVSAARILKERGFDARFILAGYKDLKNPSGLNEEELKNLNKENIVEIVGYHQDIKELYAKSHIVCLPSYREGFPKSLIEAAAACRAVVTTNVAGCREAIIPGQTGLLVPVKNPKKLADAIQWLIEHPKQRIDMGRAGRKFAEKEFAIEKIVKQHLDIYEELLNKVK
jgi:glycosyltransferase involved in cell wall biosynthesis